MKSHTNTPTNTKKEVIFPQEQIHFSNKRIEYLKNTIREKLDQTKIESALSVWGFFENLYLFRLPHLDDDSDPTTIDASIKNWNNYIQWQKKSCIINATWNSHRLPTLDKAAFHIFLLDLSLYWLLDLDDPIMKILSVLHDDIIKILDHQNDE